MRAPSFGGLIGLVVLGWAAGCATAPERPRVVLTGDPIVDGEAEMAAAPRKDRVMWEDRIAASALRLGQYDVARAQLDDAISLIGGILANSADAKRARSMFSGENAKTFIGEPYERVMTYYYRGMLYWHDGQPDNARACFRSAAVVASEAEPEHYQETYVLLDYLDGLASARLGADGADAYARAVANARGHKLPPYDPKANLLVFAEFGEGPRKYAAGRYGEQLRFITQDSRVHSMRLTVAGHTVRLPGYDDLSYQATTRGGRVMDYILNNKAVFKSTTNTVGDVALVGSAVAASQIYDGSGRPSEGAEITAGALAAVGIVSKIVSAATTPRADTRDWDNLPQRLSFAELRVPAGNQPALVEFLDAQGQVCPDLTRELTLTVADPAQDTVVFLSELAR